MRLAITASHIQQNIRQIQTLLPTQVIVDLFLTYCRLKFVEVSLFQIRAVSVCFVNDQQFVK